MSPSVVCLTDFPAPLVNASLGQLHEVADEVIVGVDSRVGSAGLGQYAKWAYKLLRYEYTNNTQRAVSWLHRQCRGDWILVWMGIEVPSPALVAGLPELTARRDVTAVLDGSFPTKAKWCRRSAQLLFLDKSSYRADLFVITNDQRFRSAQQSGQTGYVRLEFIMLACRSMKSLKRSSIVGAWRCCCR